MSFKTVNTDRTYSYRARAEDGEVVTGTVSGSTPDDIAAILRAGLCAAGNIPLSIQHTGGNITQAMDLHMHAAFPSATLHSNSDAECYRSDVVLERFEPVNGFVRVPEAPGLGVTLDWDLLNKLKLEVLT